jgi:hypothetical protein
VRPSAETSARSPVDAYEARRACGSARWTRASAVTSSAVTPGESTVVPAGSATTYDLTHHALHALGTRALGFTHEPWDDSQPLPDLSFLVRQMAGEYPNIAAMLEGVSHDADSTLGWCDDKFEFEFALDLLLDGLERLRDAESKKAKGRGRRRA